MRRSADVIAEVYLSSPSVSVAAERLGVSRATFYRYLSRTDVREAIEAHRRQMSEYLMSQMQGLVVDTVGVLRRLMASDDEKVALSAAREVLQFVSRRLLVEREESVVITQ